MTFEAGALRGSQEPRISSVPPAHSSAGLDAVELAASAGLFLDPWQMLVLAGALGETPTGRHAAFEVGLIVPRQNGKGSILEARELAGLFVLDEQLILHSAHEFKTAAEGFRRILQLIESTPELDKQVAKVTRSHGDEGVELRTGQRLRFVARSGGSGRGFTGDCVIFDEAYNLDGRAMGALLPTLSARPNPQVWYASSAGKIESETLRAIRKRGIAGNSRSLAYYEWSADESYAITEDDTIETVDLDRLLAGAGLANPATGYRITPEFVLKEFEALDAAEFNRERLGIWESETSGGPFAPGVWDACADLSSEIDGPMMFALEISEDRSWGCIAAAGKNGDRIHVEVPEYRRRTDWIVGRLVEMCGKNQVAAVIVQPNSPAGSFIPHLQENGLRVITASTGEYAQACGSLFDLVVDGDLRHRAQPILDGSVLRAQIKPAADAYIWNRRNPTYDISPLVAVTLAVWGFRVHGVIDVSESIW